MWIVLGSRVGGGGGGGSEGVVDSREGWSWFGDVVVKGREQWKLELSDSANRRRHLEAGRII